MDYSQLPEDIIEKIARDHLPPTFSQLIRLSGVCKSWRTAVLRRGCRLLRRRRIPGLLSSPAEDSGSGYCAAEHKFLPLTMMNALSSSILAGTRSYSTLLNQMLPRVTLPIFPSTADVPSILLRRKLWGRFYDVSDTDVSNLASTIEKQHYVASFDGWLLIYQKYPGCGPHLYLINPITRVSISLPRHPPLLANALSTRQDITRAVLSCSPDNADMECHVILLLRWSPYLAWCKVSRGDRGHGSGRWKFLKSTLFKTSPKDVAYFGETLYVRDFKNVYLVCGLINSDTEPSVTSVSLSSLPRHSSDNHYHLAPDLDGQLLIIWSVNETSFRVHKLVSNNTSSEWEEVESLDGYAVFLGSHQPFSLPAASRNGVEPNRIYFSSIDGCDRGVFSLENQQSRLLDDPDHSSALRRSFWFLPMPWRDMKSQERALDVDDGGEEKEVRATHLKDFNCLKNYNRTKRLRKQ